MTGPPHCADDHCITCGDAGVPMRILSVDSASGLAVCEQSSGIRATVEIGLVGPARVGDGVLVHAGTAIARLEPGAAAG